MNTNVKPLGTPLSEEIVRDLKVGDMVSISGSIYTFRDAQHIRAFEYIKNKRKLPVSLKDQVIWHCAPAYRVENGKYNIFSAGPTTSFRVNKFEPTIISQYNVRAIIGKGGMDQPTLDAMNKYGCVYLLAVGGCAADLAKQIEYVENVYWEDLKGESIFHLKVNQFGPLFVTMDTKGNSIHKDVDEIVKDNINKLYESIKMK